MRHLPHDLRAAVRSLLRQPGFTLVAVLTLAVAIGANSVVFGLVKAVLIDPLPYHEPDRLVSLNEVHPEEGTDGVAAATLLDWRQQSRYLESVAAFTWWSYTFTEGEEPIDVPAMKVSPEILEVLGVRPSLGDPFTSEHATPGRDDVALISYGFWQRQFGGDPAVLGRRVELDGAPFTILGVMPEGFDFPPDDDQDIWTPLAFDVEAAHARRDVRSYMAVARMAEGATRRHVQEEMDVIATRIAAEHPQTNADWGVQVLSGHEWFVSYDTERPLELLLGAVGFLLLIACANVANLMLARLTGRERDIAVRGALGAGRWQIARQFLFEALIVSLLGCGVGLGLAAWGTAWVRALPQGLFFARLGQVELDVGVLLFTLGVSLVVGLGLGALPARRAASSRLQAGLRESGASIGGLRSRRLLGALVVAEVALALVLAVGAGLTARSFATLTAVDPGFETDGILAANIFIPAQRYAEDERKRQFFEQLVERLGALPGTLSAGAVSALPMEYAGIDFTLSFTVEGRPLTGDAQSPTAGFRVATPGYFETLGIPLVRGRRFEDRDRPGAPLVAVVNEAFVRRHFPGENPVGERILISRRAGGVGAHEIVGVVGDTHHYGFDSEPRPEMTVPFAQYSSFSGMVVVVRGGGDPRGLIEAVKRETFAVDPQQPIYAFNTMEELVANDLFLSRFTMLLFATFAGIALLLASVGIYGVLSYAVSQRTREIGVRMALGAHARDARRLVIGNALLLVGIGLLIGMAGAAALSRLMEGMLFGVSPLDPLVFAGVSMAFLGVGLLASWLPARRATRVDPITALRAETT